MFYSLNDKIQQWVLVFRFSTGYLYPSLFKRINMYACPELLWIFIAFMCQDLGQDLQLAIYYQSFLSNQCGFNIWKRINNTLIKMNKKLNPVLKTYLANKSSSLPTETYNVPDIFFLNTIKEQDLFCNCVH